MNARFSPVGVGFPRDPFCASCHEVAAEVCHAQKPVSKVPRAVY